ncbi:MAG: DNA polymerase domain-containing protein [archaeon]|jgi:DNA polymerase I
MEKINALLLDVSYEDTQNFSQIKVFVKENDKSYWLFDNKTRPYLYITIAENELKEKIKFLETKTFGEEGYQIYKIENTNKKLFDSIVLKVYFNKSNELFQARKEFNELGIQKYEYDIPYFKKYLIDNDLEPGQRVEIEKDGNFIKSIKKAYGEFDASMCAYDLETLFTDKFEVGREPILMASISKAKDKGYDSRIISYNTAKVDGLDIVTNEEALLYELNKEINKFDLIVTYNGDNFDMPYVTKRAQRYKKEFLINDEKIKIKRHGLDNAAEISGKQHIDAYQIMKFLQRTGSVNILKLDLENVSDKVFGIKKEKVLPIEINEAYLTKDKVKLDRLVRYNREDAETTLRLAQEFLPLFIEISRLTSQTLSNSTRASTSLMVEDLLLKETHKREIIAPNKPHEPLIRERINNPIKGAFVKEPLAGLHENIAVLDFASLYPSVIISHNISPETLNCKHAECKKNKCSDDTWFCTKEKGLFPEILGKMLAQRLEFKKAYKEKKKEGIDDKILFAKQWALKIILNSTYGYLGYPRARWYSRESASATTAWAREYIHATIKKAQEAGFDVLYGDSVTKDRLVTIKNPKGLIEVKNIEEFYKEIDEVAWERGNKRLKHPTGYFALSVNPKTKQTEWKEITAIIKHKTDKKIYRVNQKFGETIVTEDHSLLIENKHGFEETKPTQMKNKRMYHVQKIPFTEELEEIDLFEFVKDYHYIRRYKDQTKISQWHTDGKFIWFSFFNLKKQIKIKRKIKVKSKEFSALCRLLGAYVAEGSATTIKTCKNKSGASIASSNIKWLEELQKDYQLICSNAKTCIIPSTKNERTLTYNNKTITYTDNTNKLQMMNETSAQLFSCLCGQKSKGKKLPTFIFNVPLKYKIILLEKAIDGDGSHAVNKNLPYTKEYIKNNFSYTTNSLALISGISLLLKQLGRTYTINYRPSKKAYTLKTSTTHNLRIETKLTKELYSGEVYDLSVKDNENFVDSCGQILLHNTDSTFLLMNEKTKKDVENFLVQINDELPETMELELDGYYKRGIFVTKKEGGAAKKRYALIDEKENLKIVGFEYVRRDWCTLAKETQKTVIELVLKKGEPEEAANFVREVIKRLKEGKVPKEELTIITLLKRKIEDYDSIGPHVAAAKKALARGKNIDVGSLLSFIITKNGKTISEKAELEEFVNEGEYDSEYYIQNQILPAVIKILRELDYSEEDLIQGGKQSGLGAWF